MKKDFRLYQKPKAITFTKDGFDDVKQQYEKLKSERPHAVSELKKARELGDLRENGYYKASRQRLNYIDSQLLRLGYMLKHGVVKEKTQTDTVELGSNVQLEVGGDTVTYEIVGIHEADPSSGKISVISPLGSQLVRKKKGDEVTVRDYVYKIIDIS